MRGTPFLSQLSYFLQTKSWNARMHPFAHLTQNMFQLFSNLTQKIQLASAFALFLLIKTTFIAL